MATTDVREQIDRNVAWADNAIAEANDFLGILENTARYSRINFVTPFNLKKINVAVDTVADSFSGTEPSNVVIPNINASFTPGEIYIPANITVPTLNVSAPAVVIPNAPVVSLPAEPASPGAITMPAIPPAPVVSLPALPVLNDVVFPTPPAINIPQFNGVLPDLVLIPPQTTFTYNEVPYSSALLTKLGDFLSKKLNGGTGLDDVVEQQIWDKARAREAIASEEVMREAVEGFASQGFSFPPGAMQQRIVRAIASSEEKSSSLSRDIAVKQADLEQENDKIYSKMTVEFETMLIQHSDRVADRALEVAKADVQMAIALFDAQVAQYNAEIAKYKVQSEVYRDLIQAALATAEIYKIEVEAAKLTVDVQKLYVELYLAQLKGVDSLLGIYKTEMEGAKIAMDIEKTGIEAYRANISAYQSLIQAKVAEFNMYTAGIDGEKAKVDIFKAQVNAFDSEVSAQRAVAEIENIKLKSSVERERSNIESYKAQVTAYNAELSGVETKIRAEVGVYEAKVSGYNATMRAKLGNAELKLKGIDAEIQQEIASVNFSVTSAIESTKVFIKEAEIGIRAAEFGAQTYAGLATAASSGLNSVLTLAEEAITQT